MGTSPRDWKKPPTHTLKLPSGNEIEVQQIELVGLVLSDDNADIPNSLLAQISNQFSGQSPDVELFCYGGLGLPGRGDPVEQDETRGQVVDVRGTAESFVITVSVIGGKGFTTGPVRFGGMNQATIQAHQEARLKLNSASDLAEFSSFVNLVARAASVYPKLVKEVKDPDTEILDTAVAIQDRMAIFYWAMPSEVHPAGAFPEEPAAGVAATSDVQGIQP